MGYNGPPPSNSMGFVPPPPPTIYPWIPAGETQKVTNWTPVAKYVVPFSYPGQPLTQPAPAAKAPDTKTPPVDDGPKPRQYDLED